MLMRTDSFRELDRLAQQLIGPGTWSRPSAMPMDAYREGDEYVVAFDLPGVSADALDIDVERNMLTVKAERRPAAKADDVQMELSERPLGVFSRQIVLADTLDTEHIRADYDAGVLTLRIPIAERAKPRKISIGVGSGRNEISGADTGRTGAEDRHLISLLPPRPPHPVGSPKRKRRRPGRRSRGWPSRPWR